MPHLPRLLPALLVLALALPARAATIGVTTNADELNNDGDCSLREAVAAANTNAGSDACPAGSPSGDAILFTAIAGQTIMLTAGQLDLTDGVAVGSAASAVTIVSSASARIFRFSLTSPVEPMSLQNVTLRSGSGFIGGAVLVADNQPSAFTGVTFDANTSAASGGALRVGQGTSTVSGCTFINNTTTVAGVTDGGGAIYNNGGALTVTSTTFDANTAAAGSANGGAILNGFGGSLSVVTSTFRTNQAARAGGAIETAGTLTVAGGLFRDNTAGINGGAVHMTGAITATFTNAPFFDANIASQEGGAVWNSGTGTLLMTAARITNNVAGGPAADQGGGGVFSDGGTTTLRDVTITGNRAPGAAGSGGGILNTAGGQLTLQGGSVSNNVAVRAGGGIETAVTGAATSNTVSITGVTLSGNDAGTAPGNGGGLHATGAAVVTITGSQVTANRAASQGGGLWNAGTGTMTVTTTTVEGNQAGSGGGLYQQAGTGGTLTVQRSLVALNTATGAGAPGGGVLVAGGSVSLVNTTVSTNTADRGAGVAVAGSGTASLQSVTVALNTAATAGGGVLSPASSQVTLANTILDVNSAPTGPNCSGAIATTGPTIITGAGCTVSGPAPINVNATLLPLAANGGPTRTHASPPGSTADGAGSTTLTVDQRGYSRTTPTTIGAYSINGQPVAGEAGPGSAAVALSVAPNPTRSATALRVTVAASEPVEVALYDALGRRVQTLYAGTPAAESTLDIRVEAGSLAPGVYVVRATSASATATQRLTVIR